MIDNSNIGPHGPVRADAERISLDALREAGKEISRNNDSASLLDLAGKILPRELKERERVLHTGKQV
jgi:hypothetical protein